MTSHHVPKSSRPSKTRPTMPEKRPAALQWDLDQELQDHSQQSTDLHNSSPSLSPHTPFTPVCVYSHSNNIKERETTHTHTPPYSPPSLSLSAAETDPETLGEIKTWMKAHCITCINLLVRNYTVEVLDQAAEDFEVAQAQGLKIKNPSGFFRSLLK